ncbi:VOC family protein [Cellulomonas soli]
MHVDLHVEDVDAHTALAERLGATVRLRAEHVVLVSPGGLVFCLVRDRGERTRPAPVTGALGAVAIVDQVCLDVPPDAFEAEGAFWSALTGWTLHAGSRPEFAALDRPAGIPLRFLLQRLDDPGSRRGVTAHLDVACGEQQGVVAAEHVALGAQVVGAGQWWTVMRDPAGSPYCLTPRDPSTGTIASAPAPASVPAS